MDLFGVFEEDPTGQEPVADVPVAEGGSSPVHVVSSNESDVLPAKKQRREASQERAVVTDAFETEAQRQVAPSSGLLADMNEDDSVVLSHSVRHQVALPANYDYVPISQHKSDNPARTYPFTLDPFQSVSIASIERNESVLVSAHTSAGKTVVAEYAIAQSLRAKQRVIYTSPIKALSNQKYRELQATFGDVGLMTGDVTINPQASCLVMTTEILRSMLYRGSEIMREVAWVVFDEIHYMRDPERGVVWEETIILLPDNVHYVFLSATIPNAMQFAEWICRTHKQPCHVVYTNFRPTPLQHYLFPAGGEGIHLVVDEKSQFREKNFEKAMLSLQHTSDEATDKNKKNANKGKKEVSDIYKIIKMIMTKNHNPVIVFSFSKRDCESLALSVSKLEFNSEEEKGMVHKIFANAVSQLSDADRKLPQIEHILPLLQRGIGIHHSGLLPILKEVIEILFQEGLIKVLFATETFSIGLNMPAKTVVFTSVKKFDGRDFRFLTGGEYIQMSGRAGRRGLDDRGIVIMMVDEAIDSDAAKGMVKGEADQLDSAFHLSYNMILNLLRVEGISPEFMLDRCFYQFQNQDTIPVYEREIAALKERIDQYKVEHEEKIKEYYETRQELVGYDSDLQKIVSHPDHALPVLQPGRLVYIVVDDLDFGWGVVVSANRRPPSKLNVTYTPHESVLVDVLVWLSESSQINMQRKGSPKLHASISPGGQDRNGSMETISVTLDSVQRIGALKIALPRELAVLNQRRSVHKSIEEIQRRFPDGIALLDPVENMKIVDPAFFNLLRKIEVMECRLHENPVHGTANLEAEYNKYAEKAELVRERSELEGKLSKVHSLLQLDELRSRKRVLRQLGFTTGADLVELKGRVACEISSGDELVLTELIFNGTFTDLTPEQCTALLSCFVFDESSKEVIVLGPELKGPFDKLVAVVEQVTNVSRQCKLELDPKEYLAKFKHHLMEVVYQWCKGASFSKICELTDVYEGSLIRLFRRLEELLRQMAEGAKIIGSTELEDKMNRCTELIKRDLVSAPSLYL